MSNKDLFILSTRHLLNLSVFKKSKTPGYLFNKEYLNPSYERSIQTYYKVDTIRAYWELYTNIISTNRVTEISIYVQTERLMSKLYEKFPIHLNSNGVYTTLNLDRVELYPNTIGVYVTGCGGAISISPEHMLSSKRSTIHYNNVKELLTYSDFTIGLFMPDTHPQDSVVV